MADQVRLPAEEIQVEMEVQSKEPSAGPPWIQAGIQQHVKWRDGDVVISVPAKSGTTWTMNIVYQLFSGGNQTFRDIYEEVPWIEFLGYPGQPWQEVLDRIDAMPGNRRRAFKTHSAPPEVPFQSTSSGKDVKYIVVFRNPEEALVSLRPFLEQHSDAWYELWQVPRDEVCREDFPSFYNEVIDPEKMQGMLFGFLAQWWSLRHETNVLFLHYSQMKREHEATIRKIAVFLGITPGPAQWRDILEYTSFHWMKQHQDKFEAHTVGKIPILKRGAMIRKGEVGKAGDDGMTEELARHLRQCASDVCPWPEAIRWYYEGGAIPA